MMRLHEKAIKIEGYLAGGLMGPLPSPAVRGRLDQPFPATDTPRS